MLIYKFNMTTNVPCKHDCQEQLIVCCSPHCTKPLACSYCIQQHMQHIIAEGGSDFRPFLSLKDAAKHEMVPANKRLEVERVILQHE